MKKKYSGHEIDVKFPAESILVCLFPISWVPIDNDKVSNEPGSPVQPSEIRK